MKCPRCGGLTEIGGKHCSCGWRAEPEKPKAVAKLCVFNEHGDICGYPGILAQTTNGDGPWYCRKHFAVIMGWPSLQAVVTKDEPQSAIDARVNKIVPRRPGESEHAWSMRCRDYVLARINQRLDTR